ncbi:putative serine/threonine-protein kinase PBL7 isoform X1 [Wolffia australiana]
MVKCFAFLGRWYIGRGSRRGSKVESPPPAQEQQRSSSVPGSANDLIMSPRYRSSDLSPLIRRARNDVLRKNSGPELLLPRARLRHEQLQRSGLSRRRRIRQSVQGPPSDWRGKLPLTFSDNSSRKDNILDRQIVAVKVLNLHGVQGHREFITEALLLVLLNHPNLVKLIGYCADGDQRVLVYEYLSNGSLENHIHDIGPGRDSLDWESRVKIATGAAKGLAYLHHSADPCVIHRDMKSGNILLDENFNPKLSDFGIAKIGPVGNQTHVSTRVMGTYGYCAPEYAMTGQLTTKSDVYSFGVVLLELITGRKAYEPASSRRRDSALVPWAKQFQRSGWFAAMADPALQGRFSKRGLSRMAITAMKMVREDPRFRPTMLEVVALLELVSSASDGVGEDAEDEAGSSLSISRGCRSCSGAAGSGRDKEMVSST